MRKRLKALMKKHLADLNKEAWGPNAPNHLYPFHCSECGINSTERKRRSHAWFCPYSLPSGMYDEKYILVWLLVGKV